MPDPAVDLAAQVVAVEMRLAALWQQGRLIHAEIDKLTAEAYDLREALLRQQARESRETGQTRLEWETETR